MNERSSTTTGSTDLNFWNSIISGLLSSQNNFFRHNVDRIRFPKRDAFSQEIKNKFTWVAASKGWCHPSTEDQTKAMEVLGTDGLARTYALLEDQYSRDLFVKLLLYRILGPHKVKLPTNTPAHWQKLEQGKGSLVEKNVVQGIPLIGSLDRYRFENIEIVCHLLNVVNTFLLEQYRCDRAAVRCEEGDVVIDAGGSWGDTALYFAQKASKVYCYECVPSNIAILEKNLSLNSSISSKIAIIPKAVSKEPGKTLNFADVGPGSHSSSDGFQVETDSIDNLVQTQSLNRIDFIKMDIEGAEMDALLGAEQTIRQFQPKLAISLYHSLQDFVRIPQWIASLNLGYRFYLDHFTIHHEETILFATTSNPVT